MSKPEISSILFWAPGTLFDRQKDRVELMPELARIFSQRLELRAVIPDANGIGIPEATALYPEIRFTGVDLAETHYGGAIRILRNRELLPPGTLYVDHDGKRCMAAFREGLFVSVFEDARRFYRDLGAWQIVPLEYSLEGAGRILLGTGD